MPPVTVVHGRIAAVGSVNPAIIIASFAPDHWCRNVRNAKVHIFLLILQVNPIPALRDVRLDGMAILPPGPVSPVILTAPNVQVQVIPSAQFAKWILQSIKVEQHHV